MSGPAGRRARWQEFLSLFDLHVAYLPGKYNTVADVLSRWAYPASEACLSSNIHGTEQNRGLVIEWDAEKPQLIKRHCLQCSVRQGSLPCCRLRLRTLLSSCFSCFSKIPNPKLTNLCGGSLDGAPIHRHFTNSKTKTLCRDIEVSYSNAFTQLAFRCFICTHRLQCDCDCDCNSSARCAAAVRSHNTNPP